MAKAPLRVAVTGAAGQICYSLLFRIANGDVFGKDQPVILQLLDIPQSINAVKGVVMELEDCAFPLLAGVTISDDANVAFKDIDAGFLVGARPRSKGMERRDLLAANAAIFKVQGAALNTVAKKTAKIIVVGNPANTNAWILAHNAPDFPAENISAMTRLDHNRALAQLAEKTGVAVDSIQNFVIWGNHSPTMFADYFAATANGKALPELVNDEAWYKDTFIPKVAQRGTAIIEARGASSAASAANAAIDHMRDWFLGSNGNWASMAIPSDGSYGIPEGLMCSVPVITTAGGNFERVQGVELNEFQRAKIDFSVKELLEERDAVLEILSAE